MYILALETTGAHASAAIIDEMGVVFEKRSEEVLNHLQSLLPMVKELLEEHRLHLSDMTAIAASKGPGSFTGIRIGVSTARALAQALEKKTIGVPTLKAFAYNLPDYDGLICPVFDARRSQVYAGAYRWNQGQIEEVVPGAPYSIEDFLRETDRAGGERMFFGDGIRAYESFFDDKILAPENARFQAAASVARLARDMLEAGMETDYEELMPDYMRKAEAERRLEEKRK